MSKGKYKIKSLKELLTLYDIEISCPIVVDDIVTPYNITTHGRVYKIVNGTVKYITLNLDDGGYLRVSMYFMDKNNRKQRVAVMVHRLVAMAFIPNPNPDIFTEVNHKKGEEKTNNHVWNLEWCDHSYNMKHAYENGLHRRGEDSVLSVYTEKQIRYVCEMLQANKKTRTEISFKSGVALYTIEAILSHKKWTHISKEYDIDKYDVKAINTGSKPKYSDDDIEYVCKLIEKGEYTLREISAITNVGFNTIADIKRHRTWTRISSKYNF